MKRRWTIRLVVGFVLSAGMGCQSAAKFPLTEHVPMMPDSTVAAPKSKAAAPLARNTPKPTSSTIPDATPKTSLTATPTKPAVADTSLTMPTFSSVATPAKTPSTDLDLKLPDLTPSPQPSKAVQVEAVAPTKLMEKNADFKLLESEKGEVVPAVKSEKIPLTTSEKVSMTDAPHPGHAPDYSWVVGVLDRHQRGSYWTVRYAGLGEEDRWGGKVRLMEDKDLPELRSGDTVRVEGEILAPDSASSVSPGGFSYPPYRVKSIQVISKAAK